MTHDDSEEYCPVCKSSRYLNPAIQFLIEPTCYHKMCASCVDRLFGNGPGDCPVAGCGKRLRSQRFRKQTFGDITVEREVDVRKRVNKVFNRREDEFTTKREWDDYLEMVEGTTFDIVNGTKKEVEAAERTLRKYEEENKAVIERNVRKERAEAMAFLAREDAERDVLRAARQAAVFETEEEKREMLMSRRAQIEAMAKGDLEQVERIKAAYARRAEERRQKARLDVVNAKGIREGRALAMNSFLAKVGKEDEEQEEEEEEEWQPLGKGVDDTSRYYTILDEYPRYDWVDDFVDRTDVSAGGYSRKEWYQRSLFEAFSGLTVFVKDNGKGEMDGEAERAAGRPLPDRTDITVIDAVS
ncbi:CDK-activating kinase assembly factor MAT1-domain-containing protein [Tricharina praecox]|uniref:CDK-activating kinase assembly factor MAT1-domain-containing protein n=1 Tax=Tricharina praecox TaxID=43433 RepID=UPI0022202A81|nr:CDK-activating kinase assembly factor MAT1-domain-containing protein [Tricharina praecox]KAI5858401.1 CDK-activating kinase assembly factor MAT1-domain-containing protein [Tricharina praecox]